jgi:hypothetical protein
MDSIILCMSFFRVNTLMNQRSCLHQNCMDLLERLEFKLETQVSQSSISHPAFSILSIVPCDLLNTRGVISNLTTTNQQLL